MHAFWLVLTYDLLEDRRIDDVIIQTFFHRWRQNVVRTSVTHSAAPRVPLFCSYHILTSSVIYYWIDALQLGIYLLNVTIWISQVTLAVCSVSCVSFLASAIVWAVSVIARSVHITRTAIGQTFIDIWNGVENEFMKIFHVDL